MKPINKPDITNEEPEYWERVLESHRLGIRQLRLQEDIEEETEVELISLEELNERRLETTAQKD